MLIIKEGQSEVLQRSTMFIEKGYQLDLLQRSTMFIENEKNEC